MEEHAKRRPMSLSPVTPLSPPQQQQQQQVNRPATQSLSAIPYGAAGTGVRALRHSTGAFAQRPHDPAKPAGGGALLPPPSPSSRPESLLPRPHSPAKRLSSPRRSLADFHEVRLAPVHLPLNPITARSTPQTTLSRVSLQTTRKRVATVRYAAAAVP